MIYSCVKEYEVIRDDCREMYALEAASSRNSSSPASETEIDQLSKRYTESTAQLLAE